MTFDHGEDRELGGLYQGLPLQGEHPDEETWVRFASDAMTADERSALSDHLVSCIDCIQVFRAVAALKAHAAPAMTSSTGQIEVHPVAATPVWRHRISWLATAATLALAVTVALLQLRPAKTPPPVSAVAPGTAAQAPSPAPPAMSPLRAPPGPRAWATDPQAPAVELPARYALVTRGEGSKQAFLKAFGGAIAPYREGRYDEAATRLEPVARAFPDVPEASFYLGVSRLLMGDARGALEPLARARRAETLGEAARWFEAVAAERAGESGAADARLRELCDARGDFQARACAALEGTGPR